MLTENNNNLNFVVPFGSIPNLKRKRSFTFFDFTNPVKKESKLIKKMNKPHKKSLSGIDTLENEVIKLVNVSKSYTNDFANYHILKDINLSITEGEFVVILGQSGSGKTTLLSILSALERPTTGFSHVIEKDTIVLSDAELTSLRKKYVGYIYQQFSLLANLTVEDNVKLMMNQNKSGDKPFTIEDLLNYVDLYEHRKKKASQLSGGQAQRVAICRSLIKNPKILFGDEPTGAIHVDATKQVLNLFLKLNHDYKTTVVLVTHNELISKIADRVIIVNNGTIQSDEINKDKKTIDEINWEEAM